MKDRITALGTSIPWSEFVTVLDQAKRILGWLQSGVISSGKLHRSMHYAELARQFHRT